MATGPVSTYNAPQADAAEQPSSDADFRHTPSPNPPGSVATDTDGAAGVDPGHPHLFHLTAALASTYDGGGLQGCHGGNWPILGGQFAASYLVRLEPGGFREPHWHPSAWEMNFVVQGKVRWTFVGPETAEDSFEAGAGDIIFAPQGHFHYFENASDTDELVVLIVFNSGAAEPGDDIGIAHSLSAMPPEVLAGTFGVDPQVFRDLPKKRGRVVIGRRPGESA